MNTLIKNKQLIYLFLCNFAILFVGFGLFPLLPLYAAEFGASASFIGIYLAITYIAISIGSILTGRLSERVPRKTLFTAAGLLGVPALILLGQAQALWQVVILTALVWFAGGVGLSISNVLTSLHAASSMRGRAFGLTSLATPLGALIGGATLGQFVRWQGYPLVFAATAVVWMMWPVLAISKIEDKQNCVSPSPAPRTVSTAERPGTVFMLLLVTVLLASMTVSVVRLGLSISMKASQFSASEVSAANAFGGLITIPLTLMIGALSDTLGRKRLLTLGYLFAAGSAITLIAARQLWQFWIVSSLVLVARSVISSMSPAYATDLLRRKALGQALPLVGTMNWVSGVIGFAGSGYVMDMFGVTSLYGAVTFIAIISVGMMALLPSGIEVTRTRPVMDSKDYIQSSR